jgi:SAM-dependent methyltransferase
LTIGHQVKAMERKTCYAAERNKIHILEVLRSKVEGLQRNERNPIKVLEIASGTGEHAQLFASSISNILYQPTEPMQEMHDSIRAWSSELSCVLPPIALDVNVEDNLSLLPNEFKDGNVDVMICINMIHISPFQSTINLFRLANACLKTDGFLLTYGPYRVNGEMVESNVAFDKSLKERNPEWGVRDLETLNEVAGRFAMEVKEVVNMPANNLCVVFKRC